jgi:hypothetical protein
MRSVMLCEFRKVVSNLTGEHVRAAAQIREPDTKSHSLGFVLIPATVAEGIAVKAAVGRPSHDTLQRLHKSSSRMAEQRTDRRALNQVVA